MEDAIEESGTYLGILDEGQENFARKASLADGEYRVPVAPPGAV
jgi:hypothetical protein